VLLQRRRRRLRRKYFVGGYLTRALADERVRRAALANETDESQTPVDSAVLEAENRLPAFFWFGAPVQ